MLYLGSVFMRLAGKPLGALSFGPLRPIRIFGALRFDAYVLQGSLMRRSEFMSELKKGGRLYLFLVCVAWFTGIAVAQETSYTADSLIATFKKGSNISVKGAGITLTAVVAEVKKSSVVFKSSDNDKVICELTGGIIGGTLPVVGQSFTVVGKVKGRGMLGNVTLEYCNAATEVASTKPAVDQPVHEVIPAAVAVQEEPVQQVVEPGNVEKTPAVTPIVAARTSLGVPARNTVKIAANAAPIDTPLPERPEIPTIDSTASSSPSVAQQEPPKPAPSKSWLAPGFLQGVGVTLLGIVGLFVLLKFVPAMLNRVRPPENLTVTEKVRRDALEALLAADKKK
jgi:hypothetical protein